MRFASLENSTLGQPEVGVGIIPAGGAIERLSVLVGGARALEIVTSANDYDARTAELYGWINRAVPDVELDYFVDQFARRLARFDRQALAAAKRLIRGRSPAASIDAYRETLAELRGFVNSPTTHARRAAVVRHATAVGGDFELRMGHHLGLIESDGPSEWAVDVNR
jgi:enoyl-CoA hydratase/carnithine racemase